ncbi:OTU domain-containing protein 4 [Aethina tumida]|uniref:OTU domain-containing protein 4 n=1 Tax=Aethina tumida TaxID=116153 RepID=UPI002147B8A7|nr:OTU domain-containing protein 4 [Aethina tumida]
MRANRFNQMGTKQPKKGKCPGTLDNWLDNLGYYRKNVAYDETCLFRAVSEQLFDCQVYHERVRKECLIYARENYHEFQFMNIDEGNWYKHLDKLEKHMVICGNIEIQIISRKYNRDVLIFDALQHDIMEVTNLGSSNPLLLCAMDDDHYDVIYHKEHILTAGFCQSIVYKILYEEVFNISHVDEIVNSMLYEKTAVVMQSEIKKEPKSDLNSEESIEVIQEVIPANTAPFPFKVAKALDPTIYRNIEYDSWGEVRRELRLGDWYYGDDKLILGTRCVFKDRHTSENYECYIQEIIKEKNMCVVYVIKLAEKRTVRYSDLSPEDDAKPWPLPYRFSKNLVITPSPPPMPEKQTKNAKRRNKDKRRTKSCSESSTPVPTSEAPENVSAFVGIPLQMQPSTSSSNYRIQNDTNITTTATSTTTAEVHQEPINSSQTPPEIPEATTSFDSMNKVHWNQQQWHPYLTPTPDPFIWPQTPTTPHNVFNFSVKPMVASAPVTPDVMSYYDPNFAYYYNYHPFDMSNHNPFSVWPMPDTPVPPPEPYPKQDEPKQSKDYHHNDNQADHQPEPSHHPERPTLNTSLTTSTHHMDMYSPMIQMAPGTPVIYTAPPPQASDMTDLMMPSTPILYPPPPPPPPMDMQYVTPGQYVYPPTPPTTWYPAQINSQGFVFPTTPISNASAVQK